MSTPTGPHPSAVAVLAAAIVSDTAARLVTTTCDPEVFHGPHARIFEHLTGMLRTGVPVDPTSVNAVCMAGPQPEQTCAVLVDLVTSWLPLTSVPWHVEQLAEVAARIRLRRLGTTAQQMSETNDLDPELLRRRLDDVTDARVALLPPTVASMVDDHLARLDANVPAMAALPTGLGGLDRLLGGGLRPGQLAVVGARTGVGKSVLLLDIARHAALRCDTTVVFASMEMGAPEVLNRYIAAETWIDSAHLIGACLDDRDWLAVTDKLALLTSGRLHLIDGRVQSVASISAHARAVGAGLVVVDYLQLCQPAGRGSSNRQEDVAGMSRDLKILAGEQDCPILVASQVKRVPSPDEPPVLSDLRESGAIEQDADIVVLLHRNDRDELHGTQAELIVAKNRSGPTGSVDLEFYGHHSSFRESSRPEGWA